MSQTTRAGILQAALRLFVTRGYAETTIRDLAAEVGLTSAALYYHFPNKEACLEALVTPYLEDVDEMLRKHPAGSTALDQKERRALLSEYLALLMRSPDLTRLIDRDPAVATNADFASRMSRITVEMVTRLAGTDPTSEELLRAAAAVGALRRPVLRRDVDVGPLSEELVDLALRVFDA